MIAVIRYICIRQMCFVVVVVWFTTEQNDCVHFIEHLNKSMLMLRVFEFLLY